MDQERTDSESSKARELERTAWTLRVSALSVAVNIVLACGKYGLALLSGSVALRADALHSLSDVAAAAGVLVGIKLSRLRSPDFPYGLYKLENLVALGAAGVILLTSYELARGAIEALFVPDQAAGLRNIPATLGGVVVLGALTLAWVFYERSVARRTGSPALEADAGHLYTDVLSLLAILASLIGALCGLRIDAFATLLIVVFVALTGWRLAVAALRVLLDASVERPVLQAVEDTITRQPHVVSLVSLRGRNSGSYRFIEALVQLDVHDLADASEIASSLEEEVRGAAPYVDSVMLHYEPYQKEHLLYAVPVTEDRRTVARHFGEAPGFLLVRVKTDTRRVETVEHLPNPFGDMDHGKGIQVARMLVEQGADVVITRIPIEGHGSYYALRDAHIRVIATGFAMVTDALWEQNVKITQQDISRAVQTAPFSSPERDEPDPGITNGDLADTRRPRP